MGPRLLDIQSAALGAGSHAVGYSAASKGNGRKGGVLARRPVQMFNGGELERGTPAAVCRTRRCRLHLSSVYSATEVDPAQGAVTSSMIGQLLSHIASLGGGPLVIRRGREFRAAPRKPLVGTQ